MIYLDNSASTKPRKEVINVLVQTMEENYANPDAIHDFSHKTLLKIKNAKKIVLKLTEFTLQQVAEMEITLYCKELSMQIHE